MDAFGAKQTGANKITITGSNLTNTLSDYVIKRGNTAITMAEVTVNEAKNEAVLVSGASSLTAGNYTATVGDKTAEFTVEASVIDSIEVVGDALVLDKAYPCETGTIGYVVYNQFGEDITRRTSNMNASTTFGSEAKVNTSKSIIEVKGINKAYVLGATGTVVIVNTTTGKSVTKTITLSNVATPDSFEVLGVYNKISKKQMTLSENADNSNAAVLVAVKDQYGRNMTQVIASEVAINFAPGMTSLVVDTTADYKDTVTIDGKDYVAIDVKTTKANPVKAGSATLVLVSKSTGKNVNYSIEVTNSKSVHSFEVFTLDNVYANENNEFGFTALAADGTEIKDYKTLSSSNYGVVLPDTKGSDGTTLQWSWKLNSDGSASLIYNSHNNYNLSERNSSTTQSASFQIPSSFQYKTITFSVYEAARPHSLGGVKTPAQDAANGRILGVVSGESVTIKGKSLVIYDQYGRSMDSDNYGSYENYKVVVKNITNGTNAIVSTGAVTMSALNAEKVLDFTASTIGAVTTAKAEIALRNGSEDISGSEYTLEFTAAPRDDLSDYKFSMVDNVYSKGTGDYVENKVSVTATASNGKQVRVPDDMVNVYGDIVSGGSIGTSAVLDGTTFDAELTATKVSSIDKTVRVVVNGTPFTKTIKVSNEAPKVAIAGQFASKVAVATAASVNVLLPSTVWTVDQYSEAGAVISNLTSANVINYVDKDGAGFTITKNNTKELGITASSGDSFTVTYTWASGYTLTCTYTVQ